MKKQLLFNITLLAVFFTAGAQIPDTARVLVHYKFMYIRDTADRTHPYTENMALFVGKFASAYWTYDGIVADDQFKKAWAEAAASSPDGNVRINRGRGAANSIQYYLYPNERKLFIKDNLMSNSYLVEGTMPAIDWKINGDTATFGGLHCQQATGHFKGRDYIVWFCPDIPVQTGPWKLSGLPGVIVDAHDTKNEIIFKFDGVERTTLLKSQQAGSTNTAEKDLPPILRGLDYDPNLIQPPATAIKTTQKEFDKLKEAMRKDPEAFAQAINAANSQGDGPKMDHVMVPKGAAFHGPVINNPMELPENN